MLIISWQSAQYCVSIFQLFLPKSCLVDLPVYQFDHSHTKYVRMKFHCHLFGEFLLRLLLTTMRTRTFQYTVYMSIAPKWHIYARKSSWITNKGATYHVEMGHEWETFILLILICARSSSTLFLWKLCYFCLISKDRKGVRTTQVWSNNFHLWVFYQRIPFSKMNLVKISLLNEWFSSWQFWILQTLILYWKYWNSTEIVLKYRTESCQNERRSLENRFFHGFIRIWDSTLVPFSIGIKWVFYSLKRFSSNLLWIQNPPQVSQYDVMAKISPLHPFHTTALMSSFIMGNFLISWKWRCSVRDFRY